MRLFGRRQNPADSSSPAQQNLDQARAALQNNDAAEALRLLSFAFAQDAAHRPLYELARQALRSLDSQDEAALFERALGRFERAEPFFDLGYHFIDVGNDRMAIPFLERAHLLSPRDATVANELALALCAQFQPQRGLQVLDDVLSHLDRLPFWPAYQRCWAKMLCNQPEGIRDWLDEGYKLLEVADMDDAQKSNTRYALDKLADCLGRLEATPDPRPRIDDWHFIQYGAAILDLMDDRIVENGLEVAGGRHVASWGQMDDVRLILEKLQQLLGAIGQAPRIVLGWQDRDSQIIARAASAVLSLPYGDVDDDNATTPHALIVAADNRAIDLGVLTRVIEGQTLFAFNHHWLDRSAITPDVCGVMSQSYNLPWQGGAMRVDPETQQISQSEADERDAQIIADEIAASSFETDANWPLQLDWYRARRQFLSAGRAGVARLPFITDSPVPGSFFC